MLNFTHILPKPSHSPSRNDLLEEPSTTEITSNNNAPSKTRKTKVLTRRNPINKRKMKRLVDQELRKQKLKTQIKLFPFEKEGSPSFRNAPNRNGFKRNGEMNIGAKISANLDEPIPGIESVRPISHRIKNRNVAERVECPGDFSQYSQMLHDLCMAHPYMIEMLQAEYPNILDGSFLNHDNKSSRQKKTKIQCMDFENPIGDSWESLQSIHFESRESWEISVPYSEVFKAESTLDMDLKKPAKNMLNNSSQIQDVDHSTFDPLLTSIYSSASLPESNWFSEMMFDPDEDQLVKVGPFASLKDY